MQIKNTTRICIKGLNQEKLLNELSKNFSLFDIDRKENETSFKCLYFDYRKILKILKEKNIHILNIEHQGIADKFFMLLKSYGAIIGIIFCFVAYIVQYQFVLQYEVVGVESLQKTEIVDFVKNNFSRTKSRIDTENVETALLYKYEEISFVSCIIKGQTMILNIKEKLLPEQMYGCYSPIVAKNDGKITEINLVSGTVVVKVGDIVQKGDVLVEPYVIDASGNIKGVEANAKIFAEIYNEGSVDHYDSYIEVRRTGRSKQENVVTLFGLKIYSFQDDLNFDMYEVEYEDVELIKNVVLPFKMRKTVYYELEEVMIESQFEDVKEEFVQKAKEKALENCKNCDKIIEEYYTVRHLSGVNIVNYCIVTLEEIGVLNDN